MAFTALATRAYKDPITTTYLNSIKQNDDYLITGMVQAWINFDGTATPSSRASQNVGSISRSAVGHFQITFTTGFTQAAYVPFGHAVASGFESYICNSPSGGSIFTTNTFNFRVDDQAGNARDAEFVMVGVVGVKS